VVIQITICFSSTCFFIFSILLRPFCKDIIMVFFLTNFLMFSTAFKVSNYLTDNIIISGEKEIFLMFSTASRSAFKFVIPSI